MDKNLQHPKRALVEIDLKNYNPDGEKLQRVSIRGVIKKDNKYALWTYVNIVDTFKATFMPHLPQLYELHSVLNN